MNLTRRFPLWPLLLAGCSAATTPPSPPPMASPPPAPSPPPIAGKDGGQCRTDGLARFTGRTASAALGQELLAASGAQRLRWAPPNSAMTMDFSPQRLTVHYDEAMRITGLHCG